MAGVLGRRGIRRQLSDCSKAFFHRLRGLSNTTAFGDTLRDVPMDERQRLVINRLLEGFEGKLTTVQMGGADEGLNRYRAA